MTSAYKTYCCNSSKNIYENYYTQQAGGGIPVFNGPAYQRGHGLGNIFGGLIRSAVPLLKQGLKAVGKKALQTGVQVADDVIGGQSLKDSVKKRAKTAGKELLGSVGSEISNRLQDRKKESRKRPNSSIKKNKKAKRQKRHTDIFS
jgi:hypothetical protein